MLNRKIKLLIADDHSVFRTGLKTFLSQIPHLEIAGEAGNGQDLMKLAINLNPDVIITDLDMPVMSGIQATKELCKRIPYCRVIALTVHAREESILRMLEAGALGYVLKSAVLIPPVITFISFKVPGRDVNSLVLKNGVTVCQVIVVYGGKIPRNPTAEIGIKLEAILVDL